MAPRKKVFSVVKAVKQNSRDRLGQPPPKARPCPIQSKRRSPTRATRRPSPISSENPKSLTSLFYRSRPSSLFMP